MSETQAQIKETEKKNGAFTLLKNRDFSVLFAGGFISNMGTWFTQIAVIFYALSLVTGLPENEATQAVALLTTFTLLPMLFLGPLGGVFADKYDRKKIMIIADLLGVAVAVGLIFASQMWHLYLLLTLSSSVRQFFYPARNAATPMIVEQDLLLTANGMVQTTGQLARMLGPLAAGFLIPVAGYQAAFIIDAVSYLVSALLILLVKTNLKVQQEDQTVSMKTVFVGMRDGAKITFRDNIIGFVVISFAVTIFAIGAIDPIAVPYLSFSFGLGEEDFGLMMMFSALSGVLAAIILTLKGKLNKKLFFMSFAILALGTAVMIMAVALFLPGPVVWLYVGMSFVGFTNVGFSIPFATLLQSIIKNEHLGKVSGTVDTVMTGASLLASVIAAALAKVMQLNIILVIVASIILTSGVVFMIVTKIKKLDNVAQSRENDMKIQLELQQDMKERVIFSVEATDSESLPVLNP